MEKNVCFCDSCGRAVLVLKISKPFQRLKNCSWRLDDQRLVVADGELQPSRSTGGKVLSLRKRGGCISPKFTPLFIRIGSLEFENIVHTYLQFIRYKCVLRESKSFYYCEHCWFTVRQKRRAFQRIRTSQVE